MVANPGEVLDTSTANQNDGVFLQVMPNPRDVSSYLNPVGSRTRATFRRAELGFLGVDVYTLVHTPLR